MEKKITKILTVEKQGDWVVANTPDLDRENDRIYPDKINVTDFRKNPTLFWGHNYREPWAVIGKVEEWKSDDSAFRFKPDLRESTSESDPMTIIRYLWENDLLRAASIGFIPGERKQNDEGGYDFEEVELLEISLVPLPAHQDALRMSLKALEMKQHDEPEENTGEELDPVIDDPDPPELEEPTTDQPDPEAQAEEPPHDESDPELDAIADDLQEIAQDLLEVLQ